MRQFNRTTIEQHNHKKGVTLLELLIAVSIFGLIVIGFSSIDTFSRYHVITSDKKAKLQNDASYVLEHMAKEINKAIGDVNQPEPAVSVTTIDGDPAIIAWIDYNQSGKRDSAPSDRRIAYRYQSSPDYEMRYYSDYSGSPSSYEVISRKISTFSSTYDNTETDGDPRDDYIEVQLTACWDPDGTPVACGSPDNLALSMKNRIYMPAVSTH